MAYFRQPPSSGAEATIVSKTITANGTYNASSDSADGYNPVTVNVSGPVLGTKSISANGTYTALADGYDGFSSVTVSVPGGAQATITVSYDSSFYNKTMTCSDGITTYTETTTNAGSTVFSVNASGTWTVSCNGVTRTVEVVLDYSTQMAITKTITVYGAASDTITFTDDTGAKTVTTDSAGHGSVAITFIPPNQNITFTSSIAKNPSDLTADYSKTVSISNITTEVYVMPNNALYWYGYESDEIEDISLANGWTSSWSVLAPTHNTNDITVSASSSRVSGVGTKAPHSGTFKAILQGISAASNTYGYFCNNSTKSVDRGSEQQITSSGVQLVTKSDISNNYMYSYVGSSLSVTQSIKYMAMWYE